MEWKPSWTGNCWPFVCCLFVCTPCRRPVTNCIRHSACLATVPPRDSQSGNKRCWTYPSRVQNCQVITRPGGQEERDCKKIFGDATEVESLNVTTSLILISPIARICRQRTTIQLRTDVSWMLGGGGKLFDSSLVASFFMCLYCCLFIGCFHVALPMPLELVRPMSPTDLLPCCVE